MILDHIWHCLDLPLPINVIWWSERNIGTTVICFGTEISEISASCCSETNRPHFHFFVPVTTPPNQEFSKGFVQKYLSLIPQHLLVELLFWIFLQRALCAVRCIINLCYLSLSFCFLILLQGGWLHLDGNRKNAKTLFCWLFTQFLQFESTFQNYNWYWKAPCFI